MTQEAMHKIASKCGRQEIYQRLIQAVHALNYYVFFRETAELYGVDEIIKSAQTLMIDAAAEVNVLIELLSNTCMTDAERYEMVCAEDYKCRELIDEILGGDE